jgi:hypothetical protein
VRVFVFVCVRKGWREGEKGVKEGGRKERREGGSNMYLVRLRAHLLFDH